MMLEGGTYCLLHDFEQRSHVEVVRFRTLEAVDQVRLHGYMPADGVASISSSSFVRITAGETIEFCVEGELNVEQRTPEQPAAIEAKISVDDTLDNGVIDTWTVELGGRPLVLVEGKPNTWAIPKIGMGPGLMTPPIYAQVSPRRRVYWRSKEQGIGL